MAGFPKEINVLMGKSRYEKIKQEEWGTYDVFRRAIIDSTDQDDTGIRLARSFYERMLLHFLMFSDVFTELNEENDRNETAIYILEHIKNKLAGKQYANLRARGMDAESAITIDKTLMQRILARRAEHASIEALLKQKFIKKQYEEQGRNYLFRLKGEKEIKVMRDTLAYAAMVETLQTSGKVNCREMGDRVAKENFQRIMLAHRILDTRDGYRITGEVLEQVRQVLDVLDRDQNGLLSLHKASKRIDEDVSAHHNPELWIKLRSYDENGDGYLTAEEQTRLKEALAKMIQRGIAFDKDETNMLSFEQVEAILSRELPMNK